MTIKDTYNIHKRINCIFHHFKSKKLCQKGIHNYQLRSRIVNKNKTKLWITFWKCYCCGNEIEFIDKENK